MKNLQFTIITFYQFKNNTNFDDSQILLQKFCSFHKIKGTIILALEGINGTVAGLEDSIFLLEKKLTEIGFQNLEIKKSMYKFMPFNKLKIKIKKEIVTFHNQVIKSESINSNYINSHKWNKFISKEGVLLIDVRNDFEFKIGTFKGAINPKTQNFSDFKNFVKEHLNGFKNDKIAIFCTGGIRCEKASSHMLQNGFKNIYQLHGGILRYLEDTSLQNSLWNGECFVFDNRVSVKNELKQGTYELCHACRNPIGIDDKASKNYEIGISCPQCITKISNIKKSKLKERNKQIKIAKKKGLYNPYIKYTPSDYS